MIHLQAPLPGGFEGLRGPFDVGFNTKTGLWLIACVVCNECWYHPDKPMAAVNRQRLLDHGTAHEGAEGRAG